MAVNPVAGYLAKIYMDSTEITSAANVRLSDKQNMVEITALGDSARKRYPTIQEWTLSFDLTAFDPTDSSHAALIAAKTDRTSATWKITLDSSGTHYYSGSGFIESIDITIGADDVIKASVSVQSNGAMTFT